MGGLRRGGRLGDLVGVGELVSRYRDEPAAAFRSAAAYCYLGLNAVAGVLGLALVHTFGWTFGVDPGSGETAVRWTQAVVAGTASLALLRSSLFLVRVGNQDSASARVASLRYCWGPPTWPWIGGGLPSGTGSSRR